MSRHLIPLTLSRQRKTLATECKFFSSTGMGDRLRVAIVGGGVAGLSAALHLAPLVTSGKISGPIDIFDEGGREGRDIGVGVWSTALDPFRSSDIASHQLVYEDILKNGCFVRDVGYRTPSGHWLATSRLDGTIPDLLFLREKDLLSALRKAVHYEENKGTISFRSGFPVDSIFEESKEPWSAPVVLRDSQGKTQSSERDYHLIIGAGGMNGILRTLYGGYICSRGNLSDTGSRSIDLEVSPENDPANWYLTGQAEATGVQDRGYTVFRGNSPLSMKDLNMDKSFQTWGEGKSMRFATVPLISPIDGQRKEQQVWFITTDDEDIRNEIDPIIRKEKLLAAFSKWHDPISQLVESTPAESILIERALAHRHSMGPVANFNGILTRIRERKPPSSGNGPAIVFVGDAFMTVGPLCRLFSPFSQLVRSSSSPPPPLTQFFDLDRKKLSHKVDPILAQGFTIGMEGAAALRHSLELVSETPPRRTYPELAFDPYALRDELKNRHDARLSRLIHLLRATELVQALGQPTTGTVLGILSRDIIRPLMRLTPDFIKTPIFNFMLKYSLGSPEPVVAPKSQQKS